MTLKELALWMRWAKCRLKAAEAVAFARPRSCGAPKISIEARAVTGSLSLLKALGARSA